MAQRDIFAADTFQVESKVIRLTLAEGSRHLWNHNVNGPIA